MPPYYDVFFKKNMRREDFFFFKLVDVSKLPNFRMYEL